MLTATVLVENTQVEGLSCEHGLSVLLAYRNGRHDARVLLDFGQSDAFARNATALGIDLADVDLAVLSHAHYDHADGMPAFFAMNDHAPLYLSAACAEQCWSTKAGTTEPHYIGIRQGLLERYSQRLAFVPTSHATTLAPGIHLIPHTMHGLDDVGRRAGMLLRREGTWIPDDFAHELSLVFELEPAPDGTTRLAIFNSCSHAGLPVIAEEVKATFSGAHIVAYVGGLHLVHATEEEVQDVADAIRMNGIDRLYTGHCTGAYAFGLLQNELPGRVLALKPGSRFEL